MGFWGFGGCCSGPALLLSILTDSLSSGDEAGTCYGGTCRRGDVTSDGGMLLDTAESSSESSSESSFDSESSSELAGMLLASLAAVKKGVDAFAVVIIMLGFLLCHETITMMMIVALLPWL